MKSNEVKRGQEVMYNGFEAIVLEPCINSVKIQFMIESTAKEKYVSYDSLTRISND